MDRRLAQETKFPVYVAEDPLSCVVRGTGEVLEEAALTRKSYAGGVAVWDNLDTPVDVTLPDSAFLSKERLLTVMASMNHDVM